VKKGYSIIERNFRSSYGEIDIVAFDPRDGTLVFVEVKLRSKGSMVSPLEAVDYRKRNRLRKTALKFISERKINFDSLRFDVVGVSLGEETKIEHIINAF